VLGICFLWVESLLVSESGVESLLVSESGILPKIHKKHDAYFFKLTSKKPEIRKQPTYMRNSTVQNIPAWSQLRGDDIR